MIPIIIEHLACLESRIEEHFHSVNVNDDEFEWILNLFVKLTDHPNFAFS